MEGGASAPSAGGPLQLLMCCCTKESGAGNGSVSFKLDQTSMKRSAIKSELSCSVDSDGLGGCILFFLSLFPYSQLHTLDCITSTLRGGTRPPHRHAHTDTDLNTLNISITTQKFLQRHKRQCSYLRRIFSVYWWSDEEKAWRNLVSEQSCPTC